MYKLMSKNNTQFHKVYSTGNVAAEKATVVVRSAAVAAYVQEKTSTIPN